MLLGVSVAVVLVALFVLVRGLRGRPDMDAPARSTPASAVATVAPKRDVVAAADPAPPPAMPSVNLPVLAFDEDDLDQTSIGLEAGPDDDDATKLGAARFDSGPAAKILYDDDAAPEEPTEARQLILVSATGQSDRGKRRQKNEDSLLVQERHGLFVVADGMGGYRGGEIASDLAVKTIEDAFEKETFLGHPHETMPRRASELARAIQMANRAIHARASEDRSLEGMGTTVCAARFSVRKQRLYIGHVGDSRVYRMRDGELVQMTSDHTMRDLGVVGVTEHHLSRAVGIWPTVPVDVILGKPRAGDVYLLCSDGLTKMVDDATIARILGEHPPEAAVDGLIAAANASGGKDNVTVVVVHVHAPGDAVRETSAA